MATPERPIKGERLSPADMGRFSIYNGALYWDNKKIKADVGGGKFWAMVSAIGVITGILASIVTVWLAFQNPPPASVQSGAPGPAQAPEPGPAPAK